MEPQDHSPQRLSAPESFDSRAAAPQDSPEDERSFLSDFLVGLPFALIGIGLGLELPRLFA